MAVSVDNCTSISFNCSNNTVTHTTNNTFVCLIGFYIQVVVICIIILPINIWALWLIRKTTTIHRGSASSDLLHFNLILSSIIFCIALVIVELLQSFNISNIFVFVSSYILTVTLMAQVQFYTWICVEHYLAVVHPIFYMKLKQSRYKMVWVSFTWVVSNVFGGLCLSMNYKIVVFLYCIPLSGLIILILFCGVATLVTLKKPNPGEGERGMHHQKIKAFKIIMLTMGVLMFTYSPYLCLVFFWQELYPEIICIAQTVLVSLLLPGTVFDSILYISRFFKA